MHARSALFDLYGDHLRARGGRAPVAALVRLLAPLGVPPPAVRTAVSRMVRQAWLAPVRLPDRARLRADPRAVAGWTTPPPGSTAPRTRALGRHWHLLVTRPPDRAQPRERLRAGLAFLGYARLVRRHLGRPAPIRRGRRTCSAAEGAADSFTARDDGDPSTGPPGLGLSEARRGRTTRG